MSNKKSYLSHMKVWGCLAYMKLILSNKLEAKYDKCLFVGYPKETMGYQFYNYLEQMVFVSKHVVFLEKEFLLRDNRSKVELGEIQGAQIDIDQLPESKANIHRDEITIDPSKVQALHRPSRIRTVPERYGFLISEHNDVLLIEDDDYQ